MRPTADQYRAYRESGIGRKHPLENHYTDGFRNGQKAVRDNPQHRSWYAIQARCSAVNRYANWPPYRAYQLGFARGARTA